MAVALAVAVPPLSELTGEQVRLVKKVGWGGSAGVTHDAAVELLVTGAGPSGFPVWSVEAQ